MIIDHVRLLAFANRIVTAGGSSPAEAAIVAEHLVEANLRGHDSHGVGMLVAYVRDLEAGTLKVNQTPEIVSNTGSISVSALTIFSMVTRAREAGRRDAARPARAVCGVLSLRHFGLARWRSLSLGGWWPRNPARRILASAARCCSTCPGRRCGC
jgi:LDH2 family malate/lactate/ureidoglycolate dehydrogenase